jgi:hypothetical protein
MYCRLIPLLLLLAGCQNPRPPAPEVDFVCRVRPCIVRSLGVTNWQDSEIQARQEIAARIWAQAGIQLVFEPAVYLDEDGLFRPNCPEQRERLMVYAKLWAEEHGELLVHYVDRIWLGDRECGGLANYPFNLPGSIYQWGIFISTQSYRSVLSHEYGHWVGNRHPWEIGQSQDENDCIGWQKYCDIMSYCQDRPIWPDCIDRCLREDQINTARAWCTVEPCSLVTTPTEKALAQVRQRAWRPEYTLNTEMVE